MNGENMVGLPDQAQSSGADDRIRVSALIDSELDDGAIDPTLDALLASEELRSFWLDAHRAGDWLRSDEVVGLADDRRFLRRCSIALANEPAIVAPHGRAIRASARRSASARFWIRTGLPGASIAAALAVVAWVATPLGRSDDSKNVLASSPVPAVVIAKLNTPAEPAADPSIAAGRTIDSERLSPYLAAHRDVTPFAYRGPSARPAAFTAPASNADLPRSSPSQ